MRQKNEQYVNNELNMEGAFSAAEALSCNEGAFSAAEALSCNEGAFRLPEDAHCYYCSMDSEHIKKMQPSNVLQLIMSDVYKCDECDHKTILCHFCGMYYGTYKNFKSLGFIAFYHNIRHHTKIYNEITLMNFEDWIPQICFLGSDVMVLDTSVRIDDLMNDDDEDFQDFHYTRNVNDNEGESIRESVDYFRQQTFFCVMCKSVGVDTVFDCLPSVEIVRSHIEQVHRRETREAMYLEN